MEKSHAPTTEIEESESEEQEVCVETTLENREITLPRKSRETTLPRQRRVVTPPRPRHKNSKR